jgi:NAD(P)-dependent dehydrogenase (short-subunit alcohol dehydrogenase family)
MRMLAPTVDLQESHFEWTLYQTLVAYGRSQTANILFAVAVDKQHRDRGVRAAPVHPGCIQTELDRHVDPRCLMSGVIS